MTAADKLHEEGFREGEREGFLNGHRNTLLKVLGMRFGAVPDSVVARVQADDLAELDLWIERVISAPTLAEVLGT